MSRKRNYHSKMTRLMSKQKVRLFELLEENYYILSGTPFRGNVMKTAKWEEIRDILNELGPAKTTEKWRRVWTDIRKTLKKKISLRQTYEANGAKVPDDLIYSESDLWVIRICGMDAIEKPVKIVKQEIIDSDDSYSGTPNSSVIPKRKPTRSSERVSKRRTRQTQSKPDEIIDDGSLLCPLLVFSDDKSTQCSESPSNCSPQKKKARSSSRIFEDEPVAGDTSKEDLKKLIYLQRRQLAVTRQIHERQKCHNSDQRQFNAKVTNLLEEILQQLKRNQTAK